MEKKTVFISGGAGGLGGEFARQLASQRYNLILLGRDKPKLQSFAKELKKDYGVKIKILVGDLTSEKDLERIMRNIKKEHIDLLINAAGFGINKPFHKADIDIENKLVEVHVTAPMKLCYALIPQMIARRSGSIINISSLSSFLPLRKSSVYSGTKAFLSMFSECLHLELSQYNIHVQALCPGFTRTNFHDKINTNKDLRKNKGLLRWMEPEKVVSYSLKCLKRKRIICIPGFSNRLLFFLYKIFPRYLYYHFAKSRTLYNNF